MSERKQLAFCQVAAACWFRFAFPVQLFITVQIFVPIQTFNQSSALHSSLALCRSSALQLVSALHHSSALFLVLCLTLSAAVKNRWSFCEFWRSSPLSHCLCVFACVGVHTRMPLRVCRCACLRLREHVCVTVTFETFSFLSLFFLRRRTHAKCLAASRSFQQFSLWPRRWNMTALFMMPPPPVKKPPSQPVRMYVFFHSFFLFVTGWLRSHHGCGLMW